MDSYTILNTYCIDTAVFWELMSMKSVSSFLLISFLCLSSPPSLPQSWSISQSASLCCCTNSHGGMTQEGGRWWSVGCVVSNSTAAIHRFDASVVSLIDNLALSWRILGLRTAVDICLTITDGKKMENRLEKDMHAFKVSCLVYATSCQEMILLKDLFGIIGVCYSCLLKSLHTPLVQAI